MKNAYFPYNLHLPLPNVGIGIKSYRNKWFNDTAIKSDSMHAFSIKSNWEWQFYRSKLISRMETNWHRTTNVQILRRFDWTGCCCFAFPFHFQPIQQHHDDAHSNIQLFYDKIFYWAISRAIFSTFTLALTCESLCALVSSNLYFHILLLFPFSSNKTLRLMFTCQLAVCCYSMEWLSLSPRKRKQFRKLSPLGFLASHSVTCFTRPIVIKYIDLVKQ